MDYKVTFDELRTAGDKYGNLARTGESALARAQGINLTQPDFGRIPWLQTRVFEAYRGHADECTEALEDLTQTLRDADEGMHSTADAYQQIEEDLAEAINQFFQGVLE